MLILNIGMTVWILISASAVAGRFGNSYTWKGIGIMFWCIYGAVLTVLAIWLSYYKSL